MKSALLPSVFLLGLGFVSASGQSFNPLPASIDSPADDPALVLKRLSVGSDGKTPTVKQLDPAWVQSLGRRGDPVTYTRENSKDFETVGVPVGGIGAGELYLSGDGKLWLWDIFNTLTEDNFQIEQGHAFTEPHTPGKPDHFANVLAQGFVLQTTAGGRTETRAIDKEGFAKVAFRGQYPVCYVDYADPHCPVQVGLEAFSPFVPGSVADSSYPATILNYTLTNTSPQAVDCVVGGWLENGASWRARDDTPVQLHNTTVTTPRYTALNCSATPGTDNVKPPEVFEDFESGTYKNWTVEGTAFGPAPVKVGTVPRSKLVSPDNQGQYYVDSYLNDSNDAQGKLTSRDFVIQRPYMNFLIGGGGGKDEGLRLIVDNQTVRDAHGRTTRKLRRRFWDVHDLIGKTAHLEIVDGSSGGWSFTQVDDIRFADTARQLAEESDSGTMTLALLGESAGTVGVADLGGQNDSDAVLKADPAASAQSTGVKKPKLVGGLRRQLTLAPGAKVTLHYVVSWDFPRPTGMPVTPGQRAYAGRFKSSEEVVSHLAGEFDRLADTTRLWHDTYYDSTLPYWFLDRTFLNVATLASSTCFLLGDGLFYANEGGYSCAGTCTHVWSYQPTIDLLFPELEKGLLEKVSLNAGDDGGMEAKSGGIRMRQQTGGSVAVDGQAGIILRACLADRMSADHSFLKQNYPGVKRAMDYLVEQRDSAHDGILQGSQPNTLDSDWYGKVAWLSLYYQAALRATASMADLVHDTEYAARLRALSDKGRQYVEGSLFDGEYFVEQVDDPKHPDSPGSYTGCEIDQLMGQGWAYEDGLGQIIDPVKATTALNSVWKYNYTTDVGVYRKAFPKGRWFAMPGEGGIVMGSFPKAVSDNAMQKGYGNYFNECWAGSEHFLAALMMRQGLVDKALATERTISDRYHVDKHNPWDEVECGSHYARSMASYSVYTAAAGFEYDGPEGVLGFAPRLTPDDFQAAFTTAEGWGSFSQKADGREFGAVVDLRHGKLRLATLALVPPSNRTGYTASVAVDGKQVSARPRMSEGRMLVQFASPIVLQAGQKLVVTLHGDP